MENKSEQIQYILLQLVSTQFASWSYDGLLVNLVAPEGGADLTNYVPVGSKRVGLTMQTGRV